MFQWEEELCLLLKNAKPISRTVKKRGMKKRLGTEYLRTNRKKLAIIIVLPKLARFIKENIQR